MREKTKTRKSELQENEYYGFISRNLVPANLRLKAFEDDVWNKFGSFSCFICLTRKKNIINQSNVWIYEDDDLDIIWANAEFPTRSVVQETGLATFYGEVFNHHRD